MRGNCSAGRVSWKTLSCITIIALISATAACNRGGLDLDSNLAKSSTMSPQHGAISGGDRCTITTKSFYLIGEISVRFGTAPATDVDVIDAVTLSCTVPSHSAGIVDVTITNEEGDIAVLENAFTYHNPPSIHSVVPSRGPIESETVVAIEGEYFTNASAATVTFNRIEAVDVEFIDELTLTCKAPAGSEGLVDVVVANDFGSTQLSEGFTYYIPAEIKTLVPDEANVAGGETCTISGYNFPAPGGEIGPTIVSFGKIPATDVVIVDSETITCTVPAHSAGVVNVRLDCDNGDYTLASAFTYHNVVGAEPGNGPMTGGTAVTITGSDFTTSEDTIVTFGGEDALNIVVIDSTTITCETPPADEPGAVDIYVANALGYDTFDGGFSYDDPPTADDLSPAIGPITGGTTVTITGSAFTDSADTTVTFGGTGARDVVVVDSTTISCQTPAHSAGVVDVTVKNSNGASTMPEAFVFQDPPDLISVSPGSGLFSGGTAVTLSGSDFCDIGTTTVSFGDEPASNVAVRSPTQITCVTPAHSPGAVDVVVTNEFGSDTLVDGFTYNPAPDPPTVSGVTPGYGGAAGGTAITISGSDFTTTEDTSVTIGGSAGLNVVVVNQTTITCTTPAHSAGSVDVTVGNQNGSSTLPQCFTYYGPPDVQSLLPDSGPEGGGTSVTLSGSDFADLGTTTVSFGGASATNVVVVSSTAITCTTPVHEAGTVDVVVANDFGSDMLPSAFSFNAAPEVSSVVPGHGEAAGGTSVTITGSAFTSTADTTVTIGGIAAVNVIVVDTSTITCETPAHSAGSADVVVTNRNGSGTLPGGFIFHAPPDIGSVEPRNGPAAGGTSVTIAGNHFTDFGTTSVSFGGGAAGNVVVVDATTITCTVPSHAAGTVDVIVSNDFGSDTLPGGFVYHAPPELDSVFPDDGPAAGGTAVTISGSAFTEVGTTSVAFGGAAASNVVVIGPTTITCTTPSHADGVVDVVVTNDFGSDSLPDGFTFVGPPEITDIAPDLGGKEGGTAVTISGSGFTTTADTTVTFGGNSAVGIAVVDASTITCETPSHAAGAVDVVVANSNGSHTEPDGFVYYDTPALSDLSPESGPETGGTAVTLSGSGFSTVGLTSVTFGGVAATNVSVESANTISCTAPSHSPGAVDVVMTNAFGTDTLEGAYTYTAAPQISEVAPAEGYTAGGTAVTISGSDFTSTADTIVTFDGTIALDVSVVDSTTITCTTPAHAAGSVNVAVSNSNGSDTLPGGFTFTMEPEITGLTHTRTSNQITLEWQLTAPGDEIVIYRGSEAIDIISGNAESYVYQEDSYGYFRFSVGLFVDGSRIDCDDVLVDLGRMVWDIPSGQISGFYVYLAEAVGDPYEVLPYDNPLDYSFDAGYCSCVSFKALYDETLIESGRSYYLAAASYRIASPEYIVSSLTIPLTFSYEVVVGMP